MDSTNEWAPTSGQATEMEQVLAPTSGQATEMEQVLAPTSGQATELGQAPTSGQATELGQAPTSGQATASAVLPPISSPTRRFKNLVAGVGVVGLIGGAAFAARTLAGPSENTPTEAVQSLMAAASKSDVIGVMEQMAPGERNILIENGVPILEELKRLDVLAPNMNLSSVDGTSIAFTGQSFSESVVRDDIVSVKVSGGTVTLGGSAGKIFGGVVKKAAGPNAFPDQKPTTKNFDVTTLTTIRRNGRWYVSGAYSVAEAARKSSGKPMPAMAQSVTPVGADSPEAALRQMIEAGAELDVRKVIAMMDPDELGALQDYAPLFLEDAEASLKEAKTKFSVTFPKLEIATSRSGGTTKVKVVTMSIDAKVENFEGQPARLLLEGDCVTLTAKAKSSKRCGDEVSKLTEDVLGGGGAPFGFKLSSPATFTNSTELVVVERNGRWFVAPIRSAMGGVLSKLQGTKPGDLQNAGGLLATIPGLSTLGSTFGGQIPFPILAGQELPLQEFPDDSPVSEVVIPDTFPDTFPITLPA